jgi:hypothetical protein
MFDLDLVKSDSFYGTDGVVEIEKIEILSSRDRDR